jgi:hypothetical protein
MLERLKRLFRKESPPIEESLDSGMADSQVSDWARRHGLAFSGPTPARRFSVEGRMQGAPWRMDLGRSSRRFIQGEELRARADLGVPENITVLVMNRELKKALDKQVYQKYTHSLQTRMDSALPEEMRWLAMYDEVAWPGLSDAFWARYAVLAHQQAHAEAWLNEGLAHLLLQWPAPRFSDKTPVLLMLIKGRAQLSMACGPEDLPIIRHALKVLTQACQSARACWPGVPSILGNKPNTRSLES